MSNHIKILKGTPNHSEASLCASCSNAQRIQGERMTEQVTLCHTRGSDPARQITWHVVECSDYENKSLPSLWQMEKIAWRFSVDDKRKTAGFMSPAQWKAKGHDPDD